MIVTRVTLACEECGEESAFVDDTPQGVRFSASIVGWTTDHERDWCAACSRRRAARVAL